MKLSNETVAILKNFSAINQSILFKPGNVLKTISPQKTVMAIATVPDEFPIQACIYNLPRLLSGHAMQGDPELEFGDKYVSIIKGKSEGKIFYADPSMIMAPPEKELKLPSIDVSVNITADELQSVLRASSAFQLPEIAFVGVDGDCYMRAIDSANPSSDSFGIEIGKTNDTFTLIIKTENLHILPLDYNVQLSSNGISKFEATNVSYFIAIESKSNYKKG
jgi:hypothetical protein